MGAVGAWHTALTLIEKLKLEGTPFCGGVADIAKFFDQIRRKVVYIIARIAGMPTRILIPYTHFLENLLLYNCLAGGIGTPHTRACGIPQGCPFSMTIVALIMKPWVILMRACSVTCFILADDVLIIATGANMLDRFQKALNATHKYLQAMGARVAPDKSYNFTSTKKAANWLSNTLWEHIGQGISVITDFRYLGAHLSSVTSLRSPTLHKRWDKAIQQLRRLK